MPSVMFTAFTIEKKVKTMKAPTLASVMPSAFRYGIFSISPR